MAEEPSRLVDKSGPLELSERETRVLELFDRLQELQYQLALSHAQNGYHQGGSSPELLAHRLYSWLTMMQMTMKKTSNSNSPNVDS